MSRPRITRTREIDYREETYRGLKAGMKDLQGERLGARIELLPPGQSSSFHHYHTAEEEHVFVLEGEACLHFGDETFTLGAGDHVCFVAGEAVAHHLENVAAENLVYLVYGERNAHDVVYYPERQRVLVKQGDPRVIAYREDEPAVKPKSNS